MFRRRLLSVLLRAVASCLLVLCLDLFVHVVPWEHFVGNRICVIIIGFTTKVQTVENKITPSSLDLQISTVCFKTTVEFVHLGTRWAEEFDPHDL